MPKSREELIDNWKKLWTFSEDEIEFYNLSHDEKADLSTFEAFCKKHGGHMALLLSDDEICDNKELVLVATQYFFPADLHLLSERLLNDPEIALALARCNKGEYSKISKTLRLDADLMFQAIKRNPGIYCSLPLSIKTDRRILEYIAENAPFELFALEKVKNEVKENVKNDKKLALLAANANPASLRFFSERIKEDAEVQEVAFSISNPKEFKENILNNIWAIRYIDESCWSSDVNLVKHALKENGNLLGILPEKYRNEKRYVLIALRTSPDAIRYCSKELLDDEEVIMKALQEDTEEILSFASERVRGLYDVVYKAVGVDALNLQYASDELRDNVVIVRRAVKNYGGVLEDASKRLQKDPELREIARKNMY